MTGKAKAGSQTTGQALACNPFEGEQILLEAVFGQGEGGHPPPVAAERRGTAVRSRPRATSTPKPDHYKVVSISLYTEDIELLDGYVRELKRRGHSKANKSQVIRRALAQLDLDQLENER